MASSVSKPKKKDVSSTPAQSSKPSAIDDDKKVKKVSKLHEESKESGKEKLAKAVSAAEIVSKKEATKAEVTKPGDGKHDTSKKKKLSPVKMFLAFVMSFLSIVIIVSLVLLVFLNWVVTTPQYSYYRIYTAAQNKNYDLLVVYVDTKKIAENLTEDQKVFFEGQQVDEKAVMFQLKSKVEYTMDKMVQDGTLVEILPFRADSYWKILQNESLKKEGNTFVLDFASNSKAAEEQGVGGYRTAVFEQYGMSWRMTKLTNNPQFEEQKQFFLDQKNKQK